MLGYNLGKVTIGYRQISLQLAGLAGLFVGILNWGGGLKNARGCKHAQSANLHSKTWKNSLKKEEMGMVGYCLPTGGVITPLGWGGCKNTTMG